jgi:hypothetical protein
VTYILGGKEDHIDIAYITRRDEQEGRPKRARGSLVPFTEKTMKSAPQKKARTVLSQRPINSADELPSPPSTPSRRQPSPAQISTPVIPKKQVAVAMAVKGDFEMDSEEEEGDVQVTPVKVYSQRANAVIFALLPALGKCSKTEHGEYIVSEVRNYILGSLGAAGDSQAFDEALEHWQASNAVMILPSADDPDIPALIVV